MRCIRFDNKSTREERKKLDKLAPIKEIFEIFAQNCKNVYSTSKCAAVYEKLKVFRGKCGFKQYILSISAKYGLKIFALVDGITFYTSKMEVYVIMQPEERYQQNNRAAEVVKQLCHHISGSGRNITMDNWFTSYDLTKDLLSHNLNIVGTLKKIRGKFRRTF